MYASELQTGDRNRAIAYMMRGFGMLDDDVESVLALYFRQCSVQVTCTELAVMGATLANGGVNPITGLRALDAEYVPDVLSVMSSCGMYDYSGEWVYRVGLPAKSGVSGGVLAILPGQLAVAVFSPPLDARGQLGARAPRRANGSQRTTRCTCCASTRPAATSCAAPTGVTSSGRTASEPKRTTASSRSTLTASSSTSCRATCTSRRPRSRSSRSSATCDDVRYVVLDLRRVGDVDSAAAGLLTALDATLGDEVSLVLAHVRPAARRLFASVATETPLFENVDAALEWCEDQLLGIDRSRLPSRCSAAVDLGANDLLRGLSDEQLAEVASLAQVSEHTTGETIMREGDGSDAVYLLLSGTVTVWLDVGDDGRRHRLATFGPGHGVR